VLVGGRENMLLGGPRFEVNEESGVIPSLLFSKILLLKKKTSDPVSSGLCLLGWRSEQKEKTKVPLSEGFLCSEGTKTVEAVLPLLM